MHDKTILIMAGGTGGHVYPALAVADNLREKGFNLFWLGTNKGLESNIVPKHGYKLLTVNVSGVRGKGLRKLLFTPLMLLIALCQTMFIMIKVRPVVVLGMGGFASGPGGIAAWLMRIPLLIHEQNAIAGLTNRLLAPFAVTVLAAFPGAFSESKKLIITGNPVRNDISSLLSPEDRLTTRNTPPIRILVLGGSLGAKRLNEIIPEALLSLNNECEFKIRHQCGEKHLSETRQLYENINLNATVEAFIDDMAEAYAWADLVICRAGALTISELAACGVASILVPFPYAVDDHQTENAQYLVNENAAILIQEAQLNVEKLKETLLQLYRAPEQLLNMAINARSLSKPDATESVANFCSEAAYV
ncbi:MAG: undecaprenyldiphospho-muramoylpentapeptide beta-N-acetylglucosaminyltransferase [Proteobacteria bacterium]|nr:undecaprenyldiphospho-muramoylpentapeptide beta-N-acetylglucosaminyltransferase [Pseudomonadota bacterium]